MPGRLSDDRYYLHKGADPRWCWSFRRSRIQRKVIADGREGGPCRGRHRQGSCFGYVDVSMNKLEERPQKSRRQASRNSPHDRIDTCGPLVAAQAGVRAYERGWPHRWRLLRWRTRWCRFLSLTVTKGAIKMFGRVLPREVERRRTSVNNF